MAESPLVAIYCWPQRGHVYPTMPLARSLQQGGARVVYLGFERGERMVREQGFEYEVIGDESEVCGMFLGRVRAGAPEFLDALWRRWAERLGALGATRVLVDPMLAHAAIAALRAALPVRLFWVFEPPCFRSGRLPFTSWMLLRKTWLVRACPRLLWARALSVGHARILRALMTGRFAGRLAYLREAASFGFGPVFSSYGYLPDLPAVVFGPRALGVPADASTAYLGVGVDRQRVEPAWSPPPGSDLVFCSFGSNVQRYARAGKVLAEVMEVAAGLADHEFVVQVPARLHASLQVSRNVTLVEHAPTLKILARARAAITHAGYGVVKECIEYGVPSVFLPFAHDQPDNAARMERAGIGVALSPRSARAGRIRDALAKVTGEEGFRARLRQLGDELRRQDGTARFAAELLGEGANDVARGAPC